MTGYNIELGTVPKQHNIPITSFSESESALVQKEIEKLLQKQVIIHSKNEIKQYVSPIFLRPKKDGNYRMILNLKKTQLISNKQSFQNGYFSHLYLTGDTWMLYGFH